MTPNINNFSATVAQIDVSHFVARDPSLTIWSRLEALPTSNDLLPGLQAQLADPLWMLTRQWQFNELAGEDAATPLLSELQMRGQSITAIAPTLDGSVGLAQLNADSPPLETQVEAEAVLAVHPRLNAEAGQHLERQLQAAGLNDAIALLRTAFAATLAAPTDPVADPAGQLWHTLLTGRALDAQALRAALLPVLQDDAAYGAFRTQHGLDMLPDSLRGVLQDWLQWLAGFVYEGEASSPYWLPQRQEYQLGLFAQREESAVALRAVEYTDGRLDWHSFELAALDPQSAAAGQIREDDPLANAPTLNMRIPTPVRYPGMPADRYWEFEDSRVNFGGLEAGVTDLTRLLLTEYALVYGNDWFVIPLKLPTNALYQIANLQVIDSFGDRAQVNPAQNLDGSDWTLFELTTDRASRQTDTLFLPATVDTLEGLPVETLELSRDEMANLVWGIEKRVQGTSGDSMDRKLEAQRLSHRQEFKLDAAMAPSPQLLYRLATEVPSHWLPFLPVSSGTPAQFQTRLQRGSVVRYYRLDPDLIAFKPDLPNDYAHFIQRLQKAPFVEADPPTGNLGGFAFHPRGLLLRGDLSKTARRDFLRIEEEEVPREGIEVKRQFQYARDARGRAFLWLGRSKKVARGESSSGLRFDALSYFPT